MRWVTGFGKTNIDILYSGMSRVPQEGEEIYAENFSLQLGGGIPATLINLGRLGVPARIQTLLGKDLFSQYALSEFIANGVDPNNLYSGNDMPVNVTSAIITTHDRAFVSYTDPIKVSDNMLHQVLENSRSASIVLMQEDMLPIYAPLKMAGALLVYDTGWRDDMSLDNMRNILELADYYTPNDKEAMKVTGTSTPSQAARRLADFFETVVIKLGADGCLLYRKGRETVISPIPNIKAIDSTGAGDAFLAGFVYGLYHGAAPEVAALYGNITGAACVESVGCLASFVNEDKLLQIAQDLRHLIAR